MMRRHFETVDSTNAAAKMWAREASTPAPDGAIVTADAQTRGRGRRGRDWVSPAGKGVYLSVVWRPQIEATRVGQLTIIVALAGARALEKISGLSSNLKMQTKWPNDVLVNGKKIGGVLCEAEWENSEIKFVVAGVGLNLNFESEELPPRPIFPATSLKIETEKTYDVETAREVLIESLNEESARYLAGDWNAQRGEFIARCAILGEWVCVQNEMEEYSGVAVGIDKDAMLVLQTEAGLKQWPPAMFHFFKIMRLGFAVKVLGREGLKSNDARRWQNNPHIRVSIEYVHAIFDYLRDAKISMYRISSDFAPYLTHPEMPQFHNQLEDAKSELQALGKRANKMNLRLSFHPSQYIVLNAPNPKLVKTSARDFLAQAEMLDIMEQGEEAVVVTHVGGVYGERDVARGRFIENFKALPEPARRRLVLENDDASWGVDDVLKIHAATGIRCIFDHQHHNCFNPANLDASDACCAILKTWNRRGTPKIHFSSPRIANRIIERKDKTTGKKIQTETAPLATQHDDYIDANIFVPFAQSVMKKTKSVQPPFDVMCEAKAKDLAVLKLRDELSTLAPKFAVE